MTFLAVALVIWFVWSILRGHLKARPPWKDELWKNAVGIGALVVATAALAKGRPDIALLFGLAALVSPAGRSFLRQFKANFDGRRTGSGKTGDFDFDSRRAGAGVAQPMPPAGMTEQEAYQLLGLRNGASIADVTRAHRRLMKQAHPDAGGSTHRAARLNQAKDLLTRRHR
jgi:hypothetical protein